MVFAVESALAILLVQGSLSLQGSVSVGAGVGVGLPSVGTITPPELTITGVPPPAGNAGVGLVAGV